MNFLPDSILTRFFSGKSRRRTTTRRTRTLRGEWLETRQLMAVVVPWSSNVSYDQFTGGAATVIGVGVDDGEPDVNPRDGISDSSGVKKTPEFFGFEFNESFNRSAAVASVRGSAAGKFGLEYGYYVNGGSASSLHSGTFSYDVVDTGTGPVNISTSVNTVNGNLYTVSPKISAFVDLVAKMQASVAVDAGGGSICAPSWLGGGCASLPSTNLFTLDAINVDASASLLSINRQVRDSNGNPVFLSNGSPRFDGDIKIAGTSPAEKLANVPSDVEQQYYNAQAAERQGVIDKQAAQLDLAVAQTPAQTAAAQAKINAAQNAINTSHTTALNLKNKLGQPNKNSYTIAAGEKKLRPKPDKPDMGGGEVITFSVGTADSPLLGLKADLGLGVKVGKVGVGVPLGTATITLPDVGLVDNQPDGNGTLSASTEDAAFQADQDLVDRLQLARLDLYLGSLLGGQFNLDLGVGSLDVTILQYTLSSVLNVTQTASLTPNQAASLVKFNFVNPVTGQPVNVNATVNGVTSSGVSQIQFNPGAAVSVNPGAGVKVRVVPSLQPAYTFSNSIGLEAEFKGEPKALRAALGSLDTGYLWEPGSTTLFGTDLGEIFGNSFTVKEKLVTLSAFEIGGPTVDLTLAVTAKPGPVTTDGTPVRESFTYTITNNGGFAATNIVFTDFLPLGFAFNQATSTAGATATVQSNGTNVLYNFGTLARGAVKTITIGVNITSGDPEGSYSFLAVRNDVKELKQSDNLLVVRTVVGDTNTYHVDKAGDEDPATLAGLTIAQLVQPGQTTLRRAVMAAELHTGDDRIYIDLGNTGPLTLPVSFGEFVVRESVTIVNFSDILTLDGNDVTRLFTFGNFDINRYKLVNIGLTGGNGKGKSGFDDGYGGAVNFFDPDGNVALNRDSLTIVNSEIHDNINNFPNSFAGGVAADQGNLGLKNVTFTNNQGDYGGALNLSNSNSTLRNVTFLHNRALTGAAIENHASGPNIGQLEVIDSTFIGNNAPHGAAIYNHTFEGETAATANTSYTNSVFTGNIGDQAIVNTQFAGISVISSLGGNISDEASPSLGANDKPNTVAGIRLARSVVTGNTPGAVVGAISVVHPFLGTPVTYSVIDSRFEIVGQQLKLKRLSSLPVTASPPVKVTISATDGVLTLSREFTLTVIQPNLAPTAVALSKLTIAENTVAGIVGTFTVTDPNASDTHTFVVSDTRFEVVNRQLKLKAGVKLNFEADKTIQITITAIDRANLTFRRNFTLSVTNVNETPDVIDLSQSYLFGGVAGATVGSVTAQDPDFTTPVLTVSDARFEIVNGTLRLKAANTLNPATTPSVTMNLVATDAAGLKKTRPITIRVAPRLALTANAAYTENAAATLLASAASISHAAGQNYKGGRLIISLTSGANVADRLEIRNQGSAAGQIGISGKQVKFGGKLIGTFTGGTGASPLVVSFTTTDATTAAAQALLRNVTFRSIGESPTTVARNFTVALEDGKGSVSYPVGKAVSVKAVNDKPVLSSIPAAVLTYKKNTSAVTLAPAAVVRDVDSLNFSLGNLIVQVTAGTQAANRLEIAGQAQTLNGSVKVDGIEIGKIASVGTGTLKLTINFNTNATAARVQKLLRTITFRTTGAPTLAQRTISFTLTDGDGGTSSVAVRKVTVTN